MKTKEKNQEQTSVDTLVERIENKLNTLTITSEWKPIAIASRYNVVFTDVGLVSYDAFSESWVLCDIHGKNITRKTFFVFSVPIKVKPTIFKVVKASYGN